MPIRWMHCGVNKGNGDVICRRFVLEIINDFDGFFWAIFLDNFRPVKGEAAFASDVGFECLQFAGKEEGLGAAILEIGGIPKSGGFGRDIDDALKRSFKLLRNALT